jgi:hypothetical protein
LLKPPKMAARRAAKVEPIAASMRAQSTELKVPCAMELKLTDALSSFFLCSTH